MADSTEKQKNIKVSGEQIVEAVGKLASIETQVSELKAQLTAQSIAVSALGEKNTELQQSVTSLNSAVGQNSAAVEALDNDKADRTETNEIKSTLDTVTSSLCPENKNLLKNTAVSQTVNGVTFTVNPDRSVTCNGTASENAFFTLGGITHFSGSAIVSGAPTGGGAKIWSIQIYQLTEGEETIRTNDYGEGNTRTYTDGDYFGKIVIRAGITVDNLTFFPMLRPAGSDDTYEPYRMTAEEQLANLTERLYAIEGAV